MASAAAPALAGRWPPRRPPTDRDRPAARRKSCEELGARPEEEARGARTPVPTRAAPASAKAPDASRGPARGDDLAADPAAASANGHDARALLRVVLGAGRRRRAPAARLLLADGRRAARDPEGAVRLGGAARRAHRRRAGGDPVRHRHRHRVGGHRRARRHVPGGDGAARAAGLAVEPGRRGSRRRAGLVAGGELRPR